MTNQWLTLCPDVSSVFRRLVSSYKGKFGCVCYYARAVLDRPSQHGLQCEREFEVEEPLDVNRPDLLVRKPHNTQKDVKRDSRAKGTFCRVEPSVFPHHQFFDFLPAAC